MAALDEVQLLSSATNRGHDFKWHTLNKPTWCDFCSEFMWGLTKQCYRCQHCRMRVHLACLAQIPFCEPKNDEFSGHAFEKVHFNKPTWCDTCGGFIWGVGKQGYRCTACKRAVHSDPECRKKSGPCGAPPLNNAVVGSRRIISLLPAAARNLPQARCVFIGDPKSGKNELFAKLKKEKESLQCALPKPEENLFVCSLKDEVRGSYVYSFMLLPDFFQGDFNDIKIRQNCEDEILKVCTDATLIVVFYSTVFRDTFMHVQNWWAPKAREFVHNSGLFLVGTGTEYRSAEKERWLTDQKTTIVPFHEGLKFQKQQLCEFYECAIESGAGLQQLIAAIMKHGLDYNNSRSDAA